MALAQSAVGPAARKRIAFFDHPDVFEDFYTHYGVGQHAFATSWSNSGNHQFVRVLQQEIGDVTWYCQSVMPELRGGFHQPTGCTVKFFRSPWLHRVLWKAFYLPRAAWRWRRAYPVYAVCASYVVMFSWALMRALHRDWPEAIVVQDYSNGKFDVLLLVSKLLGAPLIALHAGSTPERYVGRTLKRLTIRRAAALVVTSGRERDLLVGRYGASPDRVRIILTPGDLSVYRPLERENACATADLDPARRYFLFVGRLEDGVKRISVLIRAFASLAADETGVDLVICGDGPDRAPMGELASKLAPERVVFTGWVGDDGRKAALYNAAEALVLPSRTEGFPTVVGEALACGTPVIATDVGGTAEVVVPGSTGFLVAVDDQRGLERAMRRLLRDPALATRMRAQARAMAEQKLSADVVAHQLRQTFEEASRVH